MAQNRTGEGTMTDPEVLLLTVRQYAVRFFVFAVLE